MSTLPSDQNASGRDLGTDELALLKSVIESGTLTSTKGETVKNLELEFAQMLGSPHAVACSSGSAAVHIAVAALDLEPGDEVITTPVTDMGALAPILFQGLIPVFADTDPATLNVTAETIAARITARTRAIIVTHLFGCPADMGPIMDLAARHGLPVIEDAAQAFLAESQGAMVGTVGAIGCFSFQQGKHMTSGEGGIVVTADPALARRMRLFVNKAWGYGDPAPDHYFLALNYRLTELQGAVALAQLRKLPSAVKRRRAMAERLTSRISGLDGLELPSAPDGGDHSYWRYPLWVDPAAIEGGVDYLAGALRELDIPAAPRYIQKPAFETEVFRDQNTFGSSAWPFTLAAPEAVDYSPARFPGTYAGLDRVLVLPFNEGFTESHVDYIADGFRKAVEAQ
ncbi:MAG: DegT/DnrJ/EryC1/StrS family aminotransferase [Acidimicrobiia bacterium]|nr:DegT/DnrJ/EryC1/StrS family aminotransferase [Acidimicrobiia bacterium]